MQEIGIRVALGAAHGDVLRLIVWQGMKLAGIGIVLGLAGAYGVTRLLRCGELRSGATGGGGCVGGGAEASVARQAPGANPNCRPPFSRSPSPAP
jgi:hypothetical protein